MNRQKHLLLFLCVLLLAIFLPPLVAVAQTDPPAEPRPAPVTDQPQQALPEAQTGQPDMQQDGQQATQPTDPGAGTTAGPLREFKPTDKIGADSAVSFPVDI